MGGQHCNSILCVPVPTFVHWVGLNAPVLCAFCSCRYVRSPYDECQLNVMYHVASGLIVFSSTPTMCSMGIMNVSKSTEMRGEDAGVWKLQTRLLGYKYSCIPFHLFQFFSFSHPSLTILMTFFNSTIAGSKLPFISIALASSLLLLYTTRKHRKTERELLPGEIPIPVPDPCLPLIGRKKDSIAHSHCS